MQIRIAAIGRLKSGPEHELTRTWLDRASATGRPLQLTGFEIKDYPESRAGSEAERRREEAVQLLRGLPEKVRLVALDETGQSLSSQKFATRLARWRDEGAADLLFVIGGPDGLDPDLRGRADLVLSLSAMTLPHRLARAVLAEQLYRATTILSGHPYHRA